MPAPAGRVKRSSRRSTAKSPAARLEDRCHTGAEGGGRGALPSESIAAETPGWLGLGWSELMMIWVVAITAGIGAVGQRLVAARPNAPAPYITAAIPFFLLMMVGEGVLLHSKARAKRRETGQVETRRQGAYSLADTWASLGAGGIQRIFFKCVVSPTVGSAPYVWIFQRAQEAGAPRLTVLDEWYGGVLALILVDFAYYWLHRCAHTNAVLWVGHSVHHGSEHYNLSTAVRQGYLQTATAWIFYLPLAPVLPPRLFLLHKQINLIYQFWVHTTVVQRLGPAELVLMTPSHHRVHHDRRVHKNFGGVLILWDRLFGSFLDEDELSALPESEAVSRPLATATAQTTAAAVSRAPPRPVARPAARPEGKFLYGTAWQLQGWTSAVVQMDEMRRLWRRVSKAGSGWQAVGCLTRGPGYYTAGHRTAGKIALPGRGGDAHPEVFRLLPVDLSPSTRRYVVLQTAGIHFGVLVVLTSKTGSPMLYPMAGLTVLALFTIGGIVSHGVTAGTIRAELLRCVGTAGWWAWQAATATHPSKIAIGFALVHVLGFEAALRLARRSSSSSAR